MELFLSVSFRKKNWDDFCSIFLPLSPEEWCVFSLRMIMGRESANTGRNLAFLRKWTPERRWFKDFLSFFCDLFISYFRSFFISSSFFIPKHLKGFLHISQVFREPRKSSQLDQVLSSYAACIKVSTWSNK